MERLNLFHAVHNCYDVTIPVTDPSLYDWCSVSDVMLQLVAVLFVAAGFLATYFIIQAGFTYFQTWGNEEKARKAKDTLYYAVVGLIIVMLSYAFVGWLQNFTMGGGGSSEYGNEGHAPVPSPYESE